MSEIRDILFELQFLGNEEIQLKVVKLHDYISNLQQENDSLRTRIKTIKRLRKKQTQKKNKYKSIIFDEEQKLKDYKSRVDNLNYAIRELEKKLCSTWQIYYDHYRLRDFKCDDMLDLIEQITNDITKLKGKYNILQNGGEKNER